MFTTKRPGSAAALAALGVLAAACGGGGEAGGGEAGGGGAPKLIGDGTLKVGYVLPETGQLAFLGPPQIQGLKFAIKQINADGGVLGKRLPDPVAGDEAGDQAVAQQSADRVLAGPVLADTVVSDGYSKVAVVARADDYGKGLADATAKSLREAGATVALSNVYDPNSTNFGAVVQKVANARPDAVVVISFEEGKQILKGLIEAGYGPAKVGVYGADGLRSEELPKLVDPKNPTVLAGMKGTAPASAENARFTAALKRFDPGLKELQYAPQAFDCMTVIALAAEQAKTNNPAVFKNAIVGITRDGTKCSTFAACKELIAAGTNIDYQGVSGPLNFIAAGEPGEATIEIYSYDKSGKLQSVKTVQSKPVS